MRIFKNKFADFQEFNFFLQNLKTFRTHFLKIFIIHEPLLWSRDVPQKIWARSVQPFMTFIGYKQTKETPKQTNLYIDMHGV